MATTLADAATPFWARGCALGSALIRLAERWLAPLLFLAVRLWMAEIFFRSGLLKIRNPSGAIYLFTEVHPVPLLAPWLAAYLVTAIELVCPVLLVLGLAARLAALPMLAMALVIQFVVGAADPAFHLTEHYYWMFLLALIVTKGPGASPSTTCWRAASAHGRAGPAPRSLADRSPNGGSSIRKPVPGEARLRGSKLASRIGLFVEAPVAVPRGRSGGDRPDCVGNS